MPFKSSVYLKSCTTHVSGGLKADVVNKYTVCINIFVFSMRLKVRRKKKGLLKRRSRRK